MEVITTDEFRAWYEALDVQANEAVVRSVTLLEERGVALGFPNSSAIEGSKYAIRELRISAGGRPIRVFYAFDPQRDAVLLIGGDTSGDAQFHKRMVPRADGIWEGYPEEQKQGLHDDGS